MKACVFTLGCKMNEVESASLMRGLEEQGIETTANLEKADLYILNTCAVTAEAERKSRQAVSRMRKFNPCAPVFVCGCASEKNSSAFSAREGVTLITGAQGKGKILDLLQKTGVFLSEEREFCEMPPPKQIKTRAFLRIQDGCNRFCTYCIIPYLRGRSRSRSAESVLKEARSSCAKEIVLTGIDISSYRDGELDLSGLIGKLKEIPARIRLGSLEEGIVTKSFLQSVKDAENVVPHFHLSLQSGSTKVLKTMNRRYTREEYLDCCRNIYEFFPDAAITTDLIAGFPTEGEEEFQDTLSIIQEVGFARIHCFPYSMREGTQAAKLSDLPMEVKKERMGRLTKAARFAERRYLEKFIGRQLDVLFEDDGGYSENYIRVYAKGATEGDFCRVKLKSLFRDGAEGEILFPYQNETTKKE